jgi:hypothetical protein
MTPENQLLFWRIILWGVAPFVGLIIIMIANFKIEGIKSAIETRKSTQAKIDRLETETRIRDDVKSAAKTTNDNIGKVSDKLDKVVIRLDDIDRKTIPVYEVINSAIGKLKYESSSSTKAIEHIKKEFSKFQKETQDQFFADQVDRTRNLESLRTGLVDLSAAVDNLAESRSKSMISEAIVVTSEYLEKGTYIEAPTHDGLVDLELSVAELKNDDRVAFKERLGATLSRAEKQRDEEINVSERQRLGQVQLVETYEPIFLKHFADMESFLQSYMEELKASGVDVRITNEKGSFNSDSFVHQAKEVLNRHNLQMRIRTYELSSKKGLHLNVHFDATFYWEKMDRGFNPFAMHLYGDEVTGFGTISWGINIQKDGQLWGGRGNPIDLKELNYLMELWIFDEKFWRQ